MHANALGNLILPCDRTHTRVHTRIFRDFEGHNYAAVPRLLQPLMDNLESQTYETFEKDPTK